ncbi:penicillin-binding protein 1A [Aestuariicella hydrocarbonica]|uniref:Penicillin-binding protein 1A n=1 Tax=Pseudomaricurvus hydrocarbonicus TaxID=1470433 RepID=A0A9E5MPQ8_9GAMM|nr:penicillin-binding protein 1A [Aestuariicella hydrocarbonica]NHO68099.1 penicillin-binding protein 1A [Aestuariicella hydrocarbonica]
MTYKEKIIPWAFWLILAAGSGTLALFAGITLYLTPKLPEVETLRQIKLQTPLRIYSDDGLLIGVFGEKRRNPVAIENVPQDFINAILSAEDDRFYSHHGVDIKGLLRAASQLLQSGQIQTGGSTITMQVARNFFLTRKQTFSRKFNEILLALQIEKELSKSEILELYANKIYLGNRAYGIGAAAQVYYGKDINDLSLAQLAMIAGLPKAPSAYNPLANPQRALVRRNWILGRMVSLDYITEEQYQVAVQEPVTASYHGSKLELSAPYIAEMARKEAVDKLGLAAYTDGFKIYTTINSQLQARAQKAVIDGLISYDLRHGYRGPEAKLTLPDALAAKTTSTEPPSASTPGDSAAAESDSAQPLTEWQQEWQQELDHYKTIGGLMAAAVTQVNADSIVFLASDGTQASVHWENGLSEARAYINENSRGPAPKQASDVLAVGDVIRVAKTQAADTGEDIWQLTQVPAAQAALVSLNPDDGAIRALVGGFDFNQSHFNRATQAERQPGSNFKPFIYTAALEQGLTPATIINDAPIVFDDASMESTWRPENASGKFFGPTRLRQALYKSRNLVSIRILRRIGINNALDTMDRYGLDKSQMPRNLSLALGTAALTPLQIATGYTVFANGGYKVSPYLVARIEDVDGNITFQALPATVCRPCEVEANTAEASEALTADSGDGNQVANAQQESLDALEKAMAAELNDQPLQPANEIASSSLDTALDPNSESENTAEDSDQLMQEAPQPPVAPRVLSPQIAYLIDDMLRDVIKKGTGRKALALGRNDLAGKTGTTNGPKDAWFSGYNNRVVTTAWLGFDQNSDLGRREYGGTSALPIWIDYMALALKDIPEAPRSLPDNLVSVRIDPNTGMRAPATQSNAIFETFRLENVPEYNQQTAPQLDHRETGATQEALPEELF